MGELVLSFQSGDPLTNTIQQVYSDFTLNIEKNLHKKAKACSRNDIKIERKRGQGGFVITLHPAIYELYKQTIRTLYSSFNLEEVEVRLDVDAEGNNHRDVISVKEAGKSFYTINLFHTTSRMQINGRQMVKFIQQDLPLCDQFVGKYLESAGQSKEECKNMLHSALNNFFLDQPSKSTPESKNHDTKKAIDNGSDVGPDAAIGSDVSSPSTVVALANDESSGESDESFSSADEDSIEVVTDTETSISPLVVADEPPLPNEALANTGTTSQPQESPDQTIPEPSQTITDNTIVTNSPPDHSNPTTLDSKSIMDLIGQLSSKINSISDQNQTTNNVLLQLSGQISECLSLKQELQKMQELNGALIKELESLRKEPYNEPTVSASKTQITSECLLIGDDSLSSAAQFLCEEVTITHIEGATINDLHSVLSKQYSEGKRYGHVILQCGATDCESLQKINTDSVASNYKLLVKAAKQISNGKVTVSSVLPRSDSADMNVKALNQKIFKITESEKCRFIDNDLNFRYVNGLPDLGVLSGQVPNLDGTKRLLSNMELPVLSISPKLPTSNPNLSSKANKSSIPKQPTDNLGANKSSTTKQPTNSSEGYVRVQGHKCTLSNFHKPPGGLSYFGEQFNSCEELYHYRKARYHYEDELAECFRWLDSPSEINKMSKMYIHESIEWNGEGGKGEEIMADVLAIRADQDREFRDELLSTGNKTLLHTVPDKVWGTGSYDLPKSGESPSGKNRFGVLLMQLRRKLQDDATRQPHPVKSPQLPTYAEVTRSNAQAPIAGASVSYRKRATQSYQPLCIYCGESGHLREKCRHSGPITCYRCGGQGHKQKHCI